MWHTMANAHVRECVSAVCVCVCTCVSCRIFCEIVARTPGDAPCILAQMACMLPYFDTGFGCGTGFGTAW